jgi:hypothetical protein
MSKLVFASVISEIQQSDVFMTVKARICEAPQANLNGARVTEAFIDEIVGNEKYVGLPLYADKKALLSGNYNRLGHLYDVKTGEFHSTQIGSFYRFEKQTFQNGCALVGFARIPKRNRKLSKAISELFADGNLKFSFELSVGEYEELDDETILIDASENNYLEGTAIVTYPACEEAVALELVAQKADDTEGGESEMAEVETKAEVIETEAAQPELAEEIEAAKEPEENPEEEAPEEEVPEEEKKEEEAACKDKKENAETSKEETAEEGKTETATVYIHEGHQETHETCAFDSETGKEVCQKVTIEQHSCDAVEGNLVESFDGVHVAESEIAEGEGDSGATNGNNESGTEGNTQGTGTTGTEGSGTSGESQAGDSEPEDLPAPDSTESKKTAEQMIAELLEAVNSLKSEIAELKEERAKPQTVTAEINPFMGDINAVNRYSLLEVEAPRTQYTLL